MSLQRSSGERAGMRGARPWSGGCFGAWPGAWFGARPGAWLAGRLGAWLVAWLALGSGLAACGSGDDATGDMPPAVDASAPACVPGCTNGGVQVCEPADMVVPCALGCNADTLACLEMVPSNGAGSEHLDGVSAALVIPAQAETRLDTDTGEIVAVTDGGDGGDGVVVRAPGEDVVDGMRFVVFANTGVAVLAVSGVSVAEGGRLLLRGTRPLVILSAGDVTIEGVIDASAFVCEGEATARCGGPGGGNGALDPTEQAGGCAPGGNGGGGAPSGGTDLDETGGGGGGFGQDGAPGGVSGDGVSVPGAGGNLNTSGCPQRTLVPLTGGSGGGAGGILDDDGVGQGGAGGGGGGGLQITSFTRIALLGAGVAAPRGIVAGGGGGGPGQSSTGGGGGGAGGAILLEAPVVELRGAVLAANGGGGGGGGFGETVTGGANGGFGADPAAGGVGNTSEGFNGGQGGSRQGPAGIGGGGGDATGGGGAGAGVIRLHVPESGLTMEEAVISPEPAVGALRLR